MLKSLSIKLFVVFAVLILTVWGKSTQRLTVARGEPFAFDCQNDETVYFARQLDEWSEVQEGSDISLSLNLKFDYTSKKKVFRVTNDAAQPENVGYYGCRKASWTSTAMNSVYQLILAGNTHWSIGGRLKNESCLSDVQSFYWTYICHGPAGSCVRTENSLEETRSTFQVSEQTRADLYCCASVTGYKQVDLKMNSIGEIQGSVSLNRKTELDDSLVICAHQHTVFRRRQETLTCELILDNRSYSTLSSDVVTKGNRESNEWRERKHQSDHLDAMPVDPEVDVPYEYTPPPRGGSDNNGDPYFRPRKPSSRGKLSTGVSFWSSSEENRSGDSFFSPGKRIALILGSILAGLVLVGLVFGLICCLCCKKKGIIDELSLYHGINLSTFSFSFSRVSCNFSSLNAIEFKVIFSFRSLLVLRKKVGEEKAFLVKADWLCHRCW